MTAIGRARAVDGDPREMEAALIEAARFAARFFRDSARGNILPRESYSEILADHQSDLPETGIPIAAFLKELTAELEARATRFGNPGFMGMITARANPYALAAETLAPALNQHVTRQDLSPLATAIESETLSWIGEFIGYGKGAEGILTSGGSAANITALAAGLRAVARFDVRRRGLRGGAPMIVYASDQSHFSVPKAVDILGLGLEQLRLIETDEVGQINVGALKEAIAKDRAQGAQPAIIIANAGTATAGAVDPIAPLADICAAEKAWLHVDGAYGAPAAATGLAGHFFEGLNRADSVVIDPHKWLYAPYECGCVLVRDEEALRAAFKYTASYAMPGGEAARDYMHLGLQMSRDFKALKVWATIKGLGAAKLRRAIEGDIALMRRLGDRIEAHPEFERLAPVVLSIACFRWRPAGVDNAEELDALNARLVNEVIADGRLFITPVQLGARRGLRACSINHRLDEEHVERFMTVLDECAKRIAAGDR